MHSLDDPDDLTSDQRRREIAAILAEGILRLRRVRQVAPESADSAHPTDSTEPADKGLDPCAMSRPHVTGG
jgi:hypothetical protein